MQLRTETIRRPIDEADCDSCGTPLRVGDRAYIDLQRGTIYCTRDCAEADAPILRLPGHHDTAA